MSEIRNGMMAGLLACGSLLGSAQPIRSGEPVPIIQVEAAIEIEALRPRQAPRVGVKDQVAIALIGIGRGDELACLSVIFEGESSWDPDALGDGGNSFGLPQRHAPVHGAPPDPWPIADQVAWAVEYADERYGSVCEASRKWSERAEARNGRGWW